MMSRRTQRPLTGRSAKVARPRPISRRGFIALATAASLPRGAAWGQHGTPLRIAQATGSRDQMITTRMLTVIYGSLKIPMVTIELPSRRAVLEASEGRLDGLTHRIFEIGVEYPTLIRVPTPINQVQPTLFVKDPALMSLDAISMADYRIGIRRGSRLAELATEGMRSVEAVTSPLQLMRLLDGGRIDAVILSRENGLAALHDLEMTSISPLPQPLSQLKLYHYLHEDHRAIVPKLDSHFKELTENGQLREMKRRFFEEVVGVPEPY